MAASQPRARPEASAPLRDGGKVTYRSGSFANADAPLRPGEEGRALGWNTPGNSACEEISL